MFETAYICFSVPWVSSLARVSPSHRQGVIRVVFLSGRLREDLCPCCFQLLEALTAFLGPWPTSSICKASGDEFSLMSHHSNLHFCFPLSLVRTLLIARSPCTHSKIASLS